MKTPLVVLVPALMLSMAAAWAVAQTSAQPAPPPANPPMSTGAASGTNPPVSQNKMQGGNPAPNQGMAPQNVAPSITPFDMLDTNKAGSLTMDQARGDRWLSQHFTQCDANHNDEVTRSEFEKCTREAGGR